MRNQKPVLIVKTFADLGTFVKSNPTRHVESINDKPLRETPKQQAEWLAKMSDSEATMHGGEV